MIFSTVRDQRIVKGMMMNRKNELLQYSTEAIAFQDSMFFKELTTICTEIKDMVKSKGVEPDAMVSVNLRLSNVIERFTKMKITVNVGANLLYEFIGPHINLPEVNRNHPLLIEEWRAGSSSMNGLRMIEEAKDALKGGVDLKNGTVSGIFTKIGAEMGYPLGFFKGDRFTPGELAAVFLHEIGHLFTYFEMFTRTVTTNRALAGLHESYNDAEKGTREALLTSVKKLLALDKLDASLLSESTKSEVVSTVIITEMLATSRAELGVSLFDMSSAEYLADEYVARQGAGRELVTGLDKLHKGAFNIFTRSSFAYFFMEVIKLLTLLHPLTWGLFISLVSMDHSGPDQYDTPTERYKRYRNQLVEALKDKRVAPERIAQLTQDIEVIDNMLVLFPGRRQLFDVLADFVVPSKRKYRQQKQLQLELEDLAANDLFIHAAKTRT